MTTWKTQDGRELKISEMTDDHLQNALKHIETRVGRINADNVQYNREVILPQSIPAFVAISNEIKARVEAKKIFSELGD